MKYLPIILCLLSFSAFSQKVPDRNVDVENPAILELVSVLEAGGVVLIRPTLDRIKIKPIHLSEILSITLIDYVYEIIASTDACKNGFEVLNAKYVCNVSAAQCNYQIERKNICVVY